MAMHSAAGTGCLATGPDGVSRDLRRAALAVPALALPSGAAAMALEPRFGLFAAALILGWTQLVGL